MSISTNNVGKDDLRRRLPPRRVRSSSRRDVILPTSDRLVKRVPGKVVDRSTPTYDCQSHSSGPSGECNLTAPINLNSVDRSGVSSSKNVYSLSNDRKNRSRQHENKPETSSRDGFHDTLPNCNQYRFRKSDGKKSAASLRKSFHKTDTLRNRAPKRLLEGGEHDLIQTKAYKQFKYTPIEYNSSSTVQSYNSSTTSSEKGKEAHQHGPKKETCSLQTSAQKTQDEKDMVQPMGYKCAEKLCEEDNPEETATKLTTEKTFRRFEALLAEKGTRHDLMKLIVSLLEIVCRSRVESHLNKVLGIIRKTNFWNTLAIFVNNLYSTKEASNDPSLPTLITNLCKIFNICLERLPDLHSTIPISQLKDTVELFQKMMRNSMILRYSNFWKI